jgi:hypothetical protein
MTLRGIERIAPHCRTKDRPAVNTSVCRVYHNDGERSSVVYAGDTFMRAIIWRSLCIERCIAYVPLLLLAMMCATTSERSAEDAVGQVFHSARLQHPMRYSDFNAETSEITFVLIPTCSCTRSISASKSSNFSSQG